MAKSEYDVQAEEFCTKHSVQIRKTYQGHRKYWETDECERAVFEIIIETPKGQHSFTFGNSIVESYEVCDAFKFSFPRWHNPNNPKSMVRRYPLPHGFPIKSLTDYALGGGGPVCWKGPFGGKVNEHWVRRSTFPPSDYSVLAGLYSQVGTFKDWCADYGYNTDSIKDRDLYFKCQELAAGLERIFTQEQLDELMEIS